MPAFFYCVDNGRAADLQNTCCISDTAAIDGHINQLFLNPRLISFVAVVQNEVLLATLRITATVPLLALPSEASLHDLGAVALGTANFLIAFHPCTRQAAG